MTSSLLFQTIDQLSREKGIDPEIVVAAVEDAILVATRKYYKSVEDLESRFNKETGHVDVCAVKKVVDQVADPDHEISLAEAQKLDPEAAVESEVRIPKATDVLGRIAAQTAKQVIFQKVREAERDTVYAEYSQRIGELINCTVKRMEGSDVILDLGRTEARMPRREQSKLETYQIGDRVRAVITLVDRAARGPQVIASRADSTLVRKLFEMEVPEIYDGTVVIKAIARESGERTKVAVYSRDPDVDCVGACVGMKGMRVQSVIRELRGEKIDIIEYNEDPVTFAANALSPAKINHVSIVDIEQRHLEVIVDDSQLSLAIGKKGQNVRLAAKLLGWQIDIKSEEEKRQEIESQMAVMALRGAPIANLEGLGGKTLERLRSANIETVEELAQMTPEELTQIQGIGDKTIERIRRVVTDYFEKGQEALEQAALEEEQAALEQAALEQAAAAEAEQALLEAGEQVAEASDSAEVVSEPEQADETEESVAVQSEEEAGETVAAEAEDVTGEAVAAEAEEEAREAEAVAESTEEESTEPEGGAEKEKIEEATEEKG
ncbi:MAG: transcription termination factor NusA [Terriglobia bacterium]